MSELFAAIETDQGAKVSVHGHCDDAFNALGRAFIENFRSRGELGAAICLYQDGVKRVDLWGGHNEPARTNAWQEDTVVTMASAMKGMMAMALHLLADRGKIDYDAPVARYWPEFAENGKDAITVRQAISHHAAIHFIDAAQPGDFFRWDNMVAAIAKQKPEWAPGTRGVYHTISIIFILGKLIACVSGEAPWDFFRREITERLGVDYHLRMTDAELARFSMDYETEHFVNDAKIPPEVLARFFAGMGDPTALLSAEEIAALPYQSAVGNARGGATLFSIAAMDGMLGDERIYSKRTLDLATAEQWHEPCAIWGTPMRMGLGLLLNDPEFFYVGPNPNAFGTAGAGGSFAMADRDNRLAVSYCVNSWWPALALGERARALVDAAYAKL